MKRGARWLALSLVLLAAGCATASPGRRDDALRARCLVDPKREATEPTRPLFFLFCIESP